MWRCISPPSVVLISVSVFVLIDFASRSQGALFAHTGLRPGSLMRLSGMANRDLPLLLFMQAEWRPTNDQFSSLMD